MLGSSHDFDDSTFINWPDDPPSIPLATTGQRHFPKQESSPPHLRYPSPPETYSVKCSSANSRSDLALTRGSLATNAPMPDLSHPKFDIVAMDAISTYPERGAGGGDYYTTNAPGLGDQNTAAYAHLMQSHLTQLSGHGDHRRTYLQQRSPISSAPPSAALAMKLESPSAVQFVREQALSLLTYDADTLSRYHSIEVHLSDVAVVDPNRDEASPIDADNGNADIQVVPGAYIRSPACVGFLADTWMLPDRCTHDLLVSGTASGVDLHYPIHELVLHAQLANLPTTVVAQPPPIPSMRPLLRLKVPHSDMIDPLLFWLHHNDEEALFDELLDRCHERGLESIVRFCTNVQYLGVCDERIRGVVQALFEPY